MRAVRKRSGTEYIMARTKQREVYGNGSVSPEKRNGEVVRDAWRVCVSLGTETYIDKDGNERKRRRKVQKTVHGTLAEARKVCKQMLEQYEHVDLESAKDDFSAVAAAWLDMARTANLCGKDQMRKYERHLGYMAKHLDGKPIIEVKKTDVEKALAAVKKERRLSNTTMHKIFQQTNRLFEYAVDSDICVRNPCRAIVAPKVDKVNSRRSLTAAEAARLRSCLDRDEKAAYEDFDAKEQRQSEWGRTFAHSSLRGLSRISGIIAVRLLLATGCRRGEILGLSWSAVDFETSQIHIRQSLNQQCEIKETKTAAGIRSLFVDAETMAHLRAWKAFQAKALHLVMAVDEKGKRRPVEQTGETPVCCSDAGGWLDPTNVNRWWGGNKSRGIEGYRDTIGFPDLKLHELRHTSATLLLGNGVDVKTVQHRLGHASSSLTLDQYAHAIPANDRTAADLMGAIYNASAEPSARIVELKRKTA